MKEGRGDGSFFPCKGTSIRNIPGNPNQEPQSLFGPSGHCVHVEFYPMPGLAHFDLSSRITLTSGFSLLSGQETGIFCPTKMQIEPCRWEFLES